MSELDISCLFWTPIRSSKHNLKVKKKQKKNLVLHPLQIFAQRSEFPYSRAMGAAEFDRAGKKAVNIALNT